METMGNKGLLNGKSVGLHLFIGVCSMVLFVGCLLLILQPLFADGQALNADAGQAGAWALLYRYGSIGVVGLWTACLLMPQRVVRLLPDIATMVLMGCVIWEAVVALNQLYGDGMSNHALYRFTGTFLNPGPFCGFLAMGMPLAVHYLVKSDKLRATSGPFGASNIGLPLQMSHDSLVARSLSLVAIITLVLCLLLLPAGMSRSAWIAAAVGGTAVYGIHRWKECIAWGRNIFRSRKRMVAGCMGITILALAGWGVFHLKEDSANGRLLMWKMACLSIAERPWTGYGSEGFPAAYAEAQERYFATGQGTESEKYVAGTPDHAFNEYLTVAVRYGLLGLGAMLAIGIGAFVCALHQRAYGLAGALLTVGVFAFSSYPFQLPDFLSVVVVMVAVVQGLKFKVQGSKFKVQGSMHQLTNSLTHQLTNLKVQSSRFKVQEEADASRRGGVCPPDKVSHNHSLGRQTLPLQQTDGCTSLNFEFETLNPMSSAPTVGNNASLSTCQLVNLSTKFLLLIVLVPLLYWGMKNADIWQARHKAAKEWRNVRTLYHMEAYSVTCEDYAPLYERMRWNHNYLFEYGRALHQTGRYEESNRILQEAARICGDPMILNIQGKNHEALGAYDQAAQLYQRAYNRLPNRLYPLYLEMEMYASPVCNRPEAAKEIARKILDTKEKIPSQAVEEIKKRAKEVAVK